MRYKVTTHDSTYTINARTFTVKGDMVIFFGGSNITEVAGFPPMQFAASSVMKRKFLCKE